MPSQQQDSTAQQITVHTSRLNAFEEAVVVGAGIAVGALVIALVVGKLLGPAIKKKLR